MWERTLGGIIGGSDSRRLLQQVKVVVPRIRSRLQRASVTSHLRGLWLRRHFTRAGIIVVYPGRPRVHIANQGTITVENISLYPGVRLECWKDAQITIGNGTYLNRNTEVIAAREVRIGRDCKIAWDVVIMDTDQHCIDGSPQVTKPIIIGDRTWIGCRAIILKGVTIGDDAIVGAGAVVTHNVPAGAIVTGPAATVKGCHGRK